MSSEGTPNLAPVEKSARIDSMDVIRGIALFGILLMNINGVGLPFSYSDPSVLGHHTGWNLRVWMANEMFFEGTMRGLFSMLFGAGVLLLTNRLERSGAGITTADIYYRRTIWLLLFGLAHAWLLLWFGDILYPYAIFGLFLFPLRHAKPKFLVLGAAALLLGGAWTYYGKYQEKYEEQQAGRAAQAVQQSGQQLTDKQKKALDAYQKTIRKKTPEEIAEAKAKEHQGYWAVVRAHAAVNQRFQTTMVYDHWVWDILSFMLIGMAFYSWRIFHGERSFRFYCLLVVVGYGIGLVVNYQKLRLKLSSGFDPTVLAQAQITTDLARLPMTLGHIGLIMLFVKWGRMRFLQSALGAVGQMALTNYLMHSVICAFIFYGFGLSLYGELQRYELLYIVGGIWLLQLVLSPIWLNHFKYGPLEWLWRSLTYLKAQPFRRTA